MRAIVERIVSTDTEPSVVEFSTDIGRGLAIWAGANPPRLGTPLDFEIDVDVELAIGVNCERTAAAAATIGFDGASVRFTCFVESVEPDRVVFLRFAESWLAMAESDGSVGAGDWIRCDLPARALRLWPIGY